MFNRLKNIALGRKARKSTAKSQNDYDSENPVSSFFSGSKKVSNLLQDYFSGLFSEIKMIKVKSKNLLQTNINLGLKHLNNDHISDAIFRFRIIAFFWPNHVKTYYYLAHCYILQKKYEKAKKYLKILLQMDPSYESKTLNMIKKIDNNLYTDDD